MKYEILKKHFGYSSFREGQEKLVDSILDGNDTLGIMPTGAGKSVCFQVPAMCMSGITIVVSPLISLMKDQVNSLIQAGIRGAYLNSSLTYRQYLKAIDNAKHGVYKIIYVAPERLETDEFMDFARNANISMITVDEAHCVSQWGHDFRPGYLNIRNFIDALPNRPVVSAFTATATGDVREDIVRILGLRNPTTVMTGFNRTNLYFEVQRPKNRMDAVLELVRERSEASGIVYCSTRKNVEDVCESLCENGIEATKYHAGMTGEERRASQDDFLFDRKNVMVATNAFGMGIDKSNVAYVIHYNMPKNIESYYQEAGRAGRDGSEAVCILLYNGQDISLNKFLINNSQNPDMDIQTAELVKQKDLRCLNKMIEYCTTTKCLRRYILDYFGERMLEDCGKCSNCNKEFVTIDVTDYARRIVSCIKETGQRFGIKTICDILRGNSGNSNVQKYELENSLSFSTLKDVKERYIREIIEALLNTGYIKKIGDEYPIITVSQSAEQLFYDNRHLKMKSNELPKKEKVKRSTSDGVENIELFELLKNKRTALAKAQGVPAFVIFSDATLRDMCILMPKNQKEMLEVSGVGYTKMKQYGKEFLKVIYEYTMGK